MPNANNITYSESREISQNQIVALYRANDWSAADKPDRLTSALMNSDGLVSAWQEDALVGLGNAISDGYLVVYYPHLLVLPEFQHQGIGKAIIERLKAQYQDFHQHILVADGAAVPFYRRVGFTRAGATEPMWIYTGGDH